jgi:hypothetical protein
MNDDYLIDPTELALRAGIRRRHARDAMKSGDLRRVHLKTDHGPVAPRHEAGKVIARARFAQRVAKRHEKHLVDVADQLRPRVSIEMAGGASNGR